MAVLSAQDAKLIFREAWFRLGERARIKTLAMDRATWLATLQALEDGYTAQRPAFKALMDTAAGTTLTNAQAKALEKAWLAWKGGSL